MTKEISTGPVDFKFNVRKIDNNNAKEKSHFNILLLGEFSINSDKVLGNHDAEELFKTQRVDRDNYQELLAKLKPRVVLELDLEGGRSNVELSFENYEDFEPDSIYKRLSIFAELKQLRRQLSKNETFSEAAKKVDAWGKTRADLPINPSKVFTPSLEPVEWDDSKSFLENVINASEPRQKPVKDLLDVDQLIKSIIAPYVLPKSDPRKVDYLNIVDEAISDLMRKILHNPDFQAVESAWRSVEFLVRRLEMNRYLTLHIMNISKQALLTDMVNQSDIQSSHFYKKLIEETIETPGGVPWSLVVTTFHFGATKVDALYLGILSRLMAGAGCPLLASGGSHLTHCSDFKSESDCNDWSFPWDVSFEETWDQVRSMDEASYIGLVAPRFVLRMPYGVRSEPVEGFKFEEFIEGNSVYRFLWGSGAVLVACVIAQSFSQSGWAFQLGEMNKVAQMPLPIVTEEGESVVQPCTEVLLTDAASNKLMLNGLMPVLSIQNVDAVMIRRFISIKKGEVPLTGPWDS